MAPNCPEEVDVFSIPHSRMKELVQKYLNMVSEINFADTAHLVNLLENLVITFKEFKAHEHIENKYIMKKLKRKLQTLSIRNTALCNCHSDNRLTDMLELVQDGYKCTQKTETDRKNFGTKLRTALEEFTEKFIPHMEEEEEVFQPLLIKYFTFEELREIKCKVLEKHFCRIDKCVKEELQEKTESPSSDSSDEECSEKQESTKESLVPSIVSHVIDRVPDELKMKILSYLNPQDLGRCAQVSHHWNRLSLDGSLWKNFSPVQWSKGNWSFVPYIDMDAEEQELLQRFDEEDGTVDEDADVDESEETDDDQAYKVKIEVNMLTCMTKYLLPKVGHSVKTINLAYSKGLVNGLLYKILSLCPHVENLDLTHTRVSDLGFKSLGKHGCGSLLKKVELSGCQNITDVTLQRLSKALHSKPVTCCNEIDDGVHEEKNEIESNEKGLKSKRMNFSSCHSTCDHEMISETNNNLNLDLLNDIEDHFEKNHHKKPENLANKRHLNIQPDSIANVMGCTTDKKSPKLTLNCGLTSAHTKTAERFHLPGGQTSLLSEKCKEHIQNHLCKHSTDIDQQKTDRTNKSVKHGVDFEIICDNSNCELEYLNLSGCLHITDRGIRALIDKGAFPDLQFLDLSGCDKITSDALTELVSVCTSLDHQYLYYCDNIAEDPYFDTASGCQNLECPTRACCRSGC